MIEITDVLKRQDTILAGRNWSPHDGSWCRPGANDLFWYGWSAQAHVHLIMLNISA